MTTFHRFELPLKPLTFSLSCPDYLRCTQERELVYTYYCHRPLKTFACHIACLKTISITSINL